MRKIEFPVGSIYDLAAIMADSAPCQAKFNDIDLVAFPGMSARDIVSEFWRRHGIRHAAALAHRYGMIPGSHHKQWLVDQMLRAILTAQEYADWEHAMNADTSCDPWDKGIAP